MKSKLILGCGCCHVRVSMSDMFYDPELEEFVCRECWPHLNWAMRELLVLRFAPSHGVKMERRYHLPEDAQ